MKMLEIQLQLRYNEQITYNTNGSEFSFALCLNLNLHKDNIKSHLYIADTVIDDG